MSAMDDPKLIETLTRMETKLDQFISTSSDHESRIRTLEQHVAPTLDHDNRLTGLEKKVWAIPGAATIISVVTCVIMVLSIPHASTQNNNNSPQPASTSISQNR